MTNKKLETFVEQEKIARTIKVKTLIIAVIWLATVVGAFIGGGIAMTNVNDYIKAQVNSQVQTLKQVSKQAQ